MPQPPRRQQLVEEAWEEVEQAMAKVGDLDLRKLRTAVSTRPATEHGSPRKVFDGGVVPERPSGPFLLIAQATVPALDTGLKRDLGPETTTLLGTLTMLENRLISRWMRASVDAPAVEAGGDLWQLGTLAARARDALAAWPGGVGLLVSTTLFATFQAGSDEQRTTLARQLGGGEVVPAIALEPIEVLFVRSGAGDHVVDLAADAAIDWDLAGATGVVLRLTEQLVLTSEPAVRPFLVKVA